MAGYWSQSRSQIHDLNGKPLIGARALFTLGGTTTPITIYQDSGLSVPHTNPVSTNGQGYFPAVFLDEADGFFNVAVSTRQGVAIYTDISIPIIGPTESGGGGGGGTPVDPDALLKTGDMVVRYGAEFRSGLVRLNGRSIGSPLSGASERANSDTETLYSYLWNLDPDIVITGGRGGNAAADYGSNKPLVLPDYRGRALIGMDTMGNIAANVIPGADMGWIGGARVHTLTINEMPNHDHQLDELPHVHNWGNTARAIQLGSGNVGAFGQGGGVPGELNTTSATTGISMRTRGGGAAHNNVQPSKVITVYMKL